MTPQLSVTEESDLFAQALTDELMDPLGGECLCCYVARMLDEYSCDGSHRHSLRYRDLVAPRATAFLKTLRQMGACCCDCELLFNAYQLRRPFGEDEDDENEDPLPPPCAGVRSRTLQPCANWMRRTRGGR